MWSEKFAILIFAVLTFLLPFELIRRRAWSHIHAGLVIAFLSSFLLPFGVFLAALIHVVKYQEEGMDNGPYMMVALAVYTLPATWGLGMIVSLLGRSGAEFLEKKLRMDEPIDRDH